MAKYRLGVMGTFTNKVGIVVGRKWRNQDVMSAYQPKVANPRSKKQVESRGRFSEASKLARAFRFVLPVGMGGITAGTKVPPRCAFISDAYKAVEFTYPDTIDVDYTMLNIAKGNHLSGSFGSPASTEALQIDVAFSYDLSRLGVDGHDEVVVVAYNPADNTIAYTRARVNVGTVSFMVPSDWNGETVYLYGFVVASWAVDKVNSPDDVSDSKYIGSVSIS